MSDASTGRPAAKSSVRLLVRRTLSVESTVGVAVDSAHPSAMVPPAHSTRHSVEGSKNVSHEAVIPSTRNTLTQVNTQKEKENDDDETEFTTRKKREEKEGG